RASEGLDQLRVLRQRARRDWRRRRAAGLDQVRRTPHADARRRAGALRLSSRRPFAALPFLYVARDDTARRRRPSADRRFRRGARDLNGNVLVFPDRKTPDSVELRRSLRRSASTSAGEMLERQRRPIHDTLQRETRLDVIDAPEAEQRFAKKPIVAV